MLKKTSLHLFWVLFSYSVILFVTSTPAVDVTINPASMAQTIEGFGGGFMFNVWPYGRENKDELYDSIFNKAGCNIVRICNSYDPQNDTEVTEVPMMKEVKERYPQVKIVMASWSPPAYLKHMDTIAGDVNGVKISLKKENGQFMYAQYADYWHKSLVHFKDSGLTPDWVSIQNEPDWPAEWEGCHMLPAESGNSCSYAKALDAVYKKVDGLGVKFIGPDMTGLDGVGVQGLDSYMNAINRNQIVGICHHFYNGADATKMRNVKQKYSSLPRYQTEYLINDNASGQTWFNHLQIIQNALVEEEVSMYLLFALAYKTASTHTFFSLDNENGGPQYKVRPIYFGFKHFSKNIHRGWKRIGASGGSLKVSAFANAAKDSIAVIIINTGGATTLNLKGIPEVIDTGEAFQTTKINGSVEQSKKYERIAGFGKTRPTINLDASSITTVNLWKTPPPVGIQSVKDKTVNSKPSFSAQVNQNRSIRISFNSNASGNYTVSLCDIAGKQVVESVTISGNNSGYTLNSPVAKGTYMIKVQSGGVVETQTIVVR
ncbi:MAG: T9SS type A sorting domain-containing protein [Chitinispirillaceae bacterium]|nr:T9SS type A sorting domain-containing protein [Chitinispirillaceae bacterium]